MGTTADGAVLVISYHLGRIVKPGTMKQVLRSLELTAAEFVRRL